MVLTDDNNCLDGYAFDEGLCKSCEEGLEKYDNLVIFFGFKPHREDRIYIGCLSHDDAPNFGKVLARSGLYDRVIKVVVIREKRCLVFPLSWVRYFFQNSLKDGVHEDDSFLIEFATVNLKALDLLETEYNKENGNE